MEELLSLAQAYHHEHDVRMSAILYEVLMEITCQAQAISGAGASGNAQDRIRQAAEQIRSQCRSPWELQTMAAISGYSPFHFSRLFHQVMGSTPAQYLLQCRLALAKQLLVSTPLSVKQIALETGFHQSSYFIRRFREHSGLSPEQFRRLRSGG
jgi:transcriptional regulator GlxA family with amidase domain